MADKDMIVEKLGRKVFPPEDYTINKAGVDNNRLPHGAFDEFVEYKSKELENWSYIYRL